jgi:hypothetical protein
MDGRPYGKLLARYAGPIAAFLFGHPEASRFDTLDFIEQTFQVRVSTVALSRFLKKYGLDAASRQAAAVPPPPTGTVLLPPPTRPPERPLRDVPTLPAGQPVPTPAPPFSARGRPTPAPSC